MKIKMMFGWEQKWKRFINIIPSRPLKEAFHLLTITLLSLLLPLSFLLLARLFCNSYFNSFSPPISSSSSSSSSLAPYILSLFFDTNPTLLLGLLSAFGISTLIHGLTATSTPGRPSPKRGPCLYASWVCLCAFQICVCLGIEGSIARKEASGFQTESSPLGSEESNRRFLSRVGFFLGLHEMMRHWARVVVKPVVDDSVLGDPREERWPEKAAAAAGFGTLWWWRLREEVEALVVVPMVKMELLMGLGVADLVGWWLYYLTITIGVVKVVKSVMWLTMILIHRGFNFRRQTRLYHDLNGHFGVEDKV